ncbi:hypothetical protein GN958_ATG08101, partial [Phytophthora infestans]
STSLAIKNNTAVQGYQVFANQQLARLQKTSDTRLIPTVRAALFILTNVVENSFASTVLRLTAIEESLRSTHTLISSLVGGRFQLAEQLDEPVPYRIARGLKSVIEVWTENTKGVAE